MVSEFWVGVGTTFAAWFPSMFPSFTVPSWVGTSVTGLTGFLASVSGIGAWVPFAVIAAVVGALVVAYGVFFVIKLVRAIASYVPFVGGAG